MSGQAITAVLGANATQTGTEITILKSDLAATGFTASTTNDGEAILIALILLAQTYLNTTNQTTITAIQTTLVSATQPSFITRNSILYRRDAITVNMDSPSTTFTLNPNNY